LSPWPFTIWVLAFAGLAARTAWQYRWKPAPWTTLLLYGFHSHLQQIPIFFGQLQFMLNRNKALMEYKDVLLIQEKVETAQPMRPADELP
jgi:hypothetical protein